MGTVRAEERETVHMYVCLCVHLLYKGLGLSLVHEGGAAIPDCGLCLVQ